MNGRRWTEDGTGAHRRGPGRRQAAAAAHGFPPLAERGAEPRAGRRPETLGIHSSDLFGRYLARLCDCGDQAAVALRSELADPCGSEPPGSAVRG